MFTYAGGRKGRHLTSSKWATSDDAPHTAASIHKRCGIDFFDTRWASAAVSTVCTTRRGTLIVVCSTPEKLKYLFTLDHVMMSSRNNDSGLPAGWEVRYTDQGQTYYVDHVHGRTQWEPPPPESSVFADLQAMYPSWEASALESVFEGCGGDLEATMRQLEAWTTTPTLATPTSSGNQSLSVVDRYQYDSVMASRLASRMPAHAIKTVLKAVSILKRKGKEAAARSGGHSSAFGSTKTHQQQPQLLSREESISAGKDLMAQRLAFLGLASLEMYDDGNCQFRAFSQELFHTQDHHAFVRERIVDQIVEDSDKYRNFVDDFEAYVYKMAKDRTWGDEIALQAFCDAFRVKIHVITTDTMHYHLEYSPNDITDAESRNMRRIFLSYIAPIHYNVVIPAR